MTWQRKNGLSANGTLDAATWNKMVQLGKVPARGSTSGSGGLSDHMNTTIRRGSTGAAVKALQRTLKLPVDGVFGPATDKAVREFQAGKQLRVTGVVTGNVWKALDGKSYDKDGSVSRSSLRRGSTGASVKELQRLLKISVDGVFGSGTEKAVREFQAGKQLRVTGVVTGNVWKALDGKSYDKDGKATASPSATAEEPKVAEAPKTSEEPKVAEAPKTSEQPRATEAPEAEEPTKKTAPSSAAVVETDTEFTPLKSTVLAPGARNAAVKSAQRALGGVAVDGSYGSGTDKAVRSFQRSKGLAETGVVDETTWDALEEEKYPFLKYRTTVLKPGSSGAAVTALQSYLNVPATGTYDIATESAIRILQGQHGLARTGYVGAVTWQALEQEVRNRH